MIYCVRRRLDYSSGRCGLPTPEIISFKLNSIAYQTPFDPADRVKDPEDLERYMNLSAWLADINNERPEKNDSYKYHLSSLEKFVMIKFTEEKTVVPPDSSVPPPIRSKYLVVKLTFEWFGEFNATSGEHTPLQKRALYKEDWLGLKVLDEKKGLVFLETEGGHVLSLECHED